MKLTDKLLLGALGVLILLTLISVVLLRVVAGS